MTVPRDLPFTGAVLAGGRSTRMGRDKALVEVDGVPMAAIACRALADAGARRVMAVGGNATALAALGMRPVGDDHPGDGPLGAILTALRAASTDVVVVLACDLPFCRPEGVRGVLAHLGGAGAADAAIHAAVPLVEGRMEPLHAAYRRACLPALARAFAAGERAPRRALGGVPVALVTDLDPSWLQSANRPADVPGG